MSPEFKKVESVVMNHAKRLNADKIFIITDSKVCGLSGEFMPETTRIITAEGERFKSIMSVELIWDALCRNGATRRSLVLNLGGGMVTDMGGFAAATFMRGISFANLPTTLLGAVDAAVGGKTGVNFNGLKNEIGVFHRPEFVIPMISMFDTLPQDQWLSGCGEVLKMSVIAGGNMLDEFARDDFILHRDPDLVGKAVGFCIRLKEQIVSEDFEDKGRRRILNFGHTYGHALEELMLEKDTPIPHGVAVVYGIEHALRLSVERQGLGGELLKKFTGILHRYFPTIQLSASDKARINQLMNFDKKNKKFGEPAYVLLGDL